MAPVIRYLHNDINSANQIWSTLSKRDKIYFCGGHVPAVKDEFMYDPEGDFAKKWIHNDFGFIVTMTIDKNLLDLLIAFVIGTISKRNIPMLLKYHLRFHLSIVVKV